MKQTNNIKKTEKRVLIFFVNLFYLLKKSFTSFIKFILNIGKQNVTIMFIPHSEKRVFNFRVNIFFLFVITIFSISIVTASIFIGVKYNEKSQFAQKAKDDIEINMQKSKEYKKLLNEIFSSHSEFNSKLNNLLSQLDSSTIERMQDAKRSIGGPHNPLERGDLSDVDQAEMDVNTLLTDYQYSIEAFIELNKMAKNYNNLIKELPFGKPVKGRYIYTSGFGFRIHPIHKVLDMHQGIDLAWTLGTPIYATAPGVVEKVDYSPSGYGWYLKISHKLGFSTLYAHMRSHPVVKPGMTVKKGQLIGYMGQTGTATGVHVHYEIRLGDNLKDPWQFVADY